MYAPKSSCTDRKLIGGEPSCRDPLEPDVAEPTWRSPSGRSTRTSHKTVRASSTSPMSGNDIDPGDWTGGEREQARSINATTSMMASPGGYQREDDEEPHAPSAGGTAGAAEACERSASWMTTGRRDPALAGGAWPTPGRPRRPRASARPRSSARSPALPRTASRKCACSTASGSRFWIANRVTSPSLTPRKVATASQSMLERAVGVERQVAGQRVGDERAPLARGDALALLAGESQLTRWLTMTPLARRPVATTMSSWSRPDRCWVCAVRRT